MEKVFCLENRDKAFNISQGHRMPELRLVLFFPLCKMCKNESNFMNGIL